MRSSISQVDRFIVPHTEKRTERYVVRAETSGSPVYLATPRGGDGRWDLISDANHAVLFLTPVEARFALGAFLAEEGPRPQLHIGVWNAGVYVINEESYTGDQIRTVQVYPARELVGTETS